MGRRSCRSGFSPRRCDEMSPVEVRRWMGGGRLGSGKWRSSRSALMWHSAARVGAGHEPRTDTARRPRAGAGRLDAPGRRRGRRRAGLAPATPARPARPRQPQAESRPTAPGPAAVVLRPGRPLAAADRGQRRLRRPPGPAQAGPLDHRRRAGGAGPGLPAAADRGPARPRRAAPGGRRRRPGRHHAADRRGRRHLPDHAGRRRLGAAPDPPQRPGARAGPASTSRWTWRPGRRRC